MFENFENRYIIMGTLTFSTPFHIGSGSGSPFTDSTVVKYHDGTPYIPGSSFKGILRSTVERLAPALGIDSCKLYNDGTECVKIISNELETEENNFKLPEKEEEYLNFLLNEARGGKGICQTCRLFGCTYLASKVQIDDLIPTETVSKTEIRDGVGIDRDTGTAVDGVKYDYEVVPQIYQFDLKLTVENADIDTGKSNDLVLLALGLSEFVNGTKIGGLNSRGLGSCKLGDGYVYKLSMENHMEKKKFLKYLTTGDYPPENKQTLQKFINDQINLLINTISGGGRIIC